MSLHHTSGRWAAIGFACVLGLGCSAQEDSKSSGRTSGSGGTVAGGTGGSNTGGGGTGIGPIGGAGGGFIGTGDGGGYEAAVPCTNLQCHQNNCQAGACKVPPCANGGTTSLSGVIYDPAGALPLYNVIVYVPHEPLMPITTGATCEQCGTVSGRPITTALTNTRGEFRLANVPVTNDIPLVIQIGKWRRQITIPNVASCADTPLMDRNQTR